MLHRIFKAIKAILPDKLAAWLRSFFTAVCTPAYFSYLNGHFKSSFLNKSVASTGEALPWYTYPAVDFLRTRDFSDKTILEFGGGQSTLWWAKRAKNVITLEEDGNWYEMLKRTIPSNAKLFLISKESREKCVAEVESALKTLEIPHYDVVIIDGLFREQMVDIACRVVRPEGAIICDNAEGYGFYDGFKDRRLKRVDFFGHAPGVIFPHCTSIFFGNNCFLFDAHQEIPTRR